MRRNYNISIPEPCHENWQTMTPMEKGRFCASCQKNVIDFTTASDSQIVKTLQQNEHLCGRFLSTQLNRYLVVRKEKKSFWIAASTAVLSFLSIGNSEVKAQEKTKTEQTDSKVILSENHLETDNREMTITGIVIESNLPFPGVNVMLKGNTTGTQTDMDGNFSIKAKKDDILVFSFIGMIDQFITIDKNTFYKIEMKPDGSDDNIIVAGYTDYYPKKKKTLKKEESCDAVPKQKTFLGRTFQKIGNWFR